MIIFLLTLPLGLYICARVLNKFKIKLIRYLTVDKLIGFTVILGLQLASIQFLFQELFSKQLWLNNIQIKIQVILLLILVFFSTKTYIQVVISDPGYLQDDKLISCPQLTPKQVNQNKITNIAEECQKHNNTLSFTDHGIDENLCIYKYDHDCSWVCNAIGILNHGIFINFLALFLVQAVAFIRHLIKIVLRLKREQNQKTLGHLIINNESNYSIILILVLFIVYFFTMIITLVTLTSQLINTCKGHTVESKHITKTLVQALKRNCCALVKGDNQQYELLKIVDYEAEQIIPMKKAIKLLKQQKPYPNGLKQLYRETKFYRYPEQLY